MNASISSAFLPAAGSELPSSAGTRSFEESGVPEEVAASCVSVRIVERAEKAGTAVSPAKIASGEETVRSKNAVISEKNRKNFNLVTFLVLGLKSDSS